MRFHVQSSTGSILLALTFVLSVLNVQNVFAADSKVFVSPAWLKANQSKVTILDMSEKTDYQKFHIDGAIWFNTAWLFRSENGVTLSAGAETIAETLSQLGIANNDHIVIYDDMGGFDASRLYWELDKLNHKNVHILDGGIVNWVLSGNKVTQKFPDRPAVAEYKLAKRSLANRLTADKTEVVAASRDNATILIDTRSEQDYQGSPSEPRSGHIPSALHFEWSQSIDSRNGFQQRAKDNLTKLLAGISVYDVKQPIILYCKSARSAARVYTMLKSLGFKEIKLYDGSMQEYKKDRNLPLKKGARP